MMPCLIEDWDGSKSAVSNASSTVIKNDALLNRGLRHFMQLKKLLCGLVIKNDALLNRGLRHLIYLAILTQDRIWLKMMPCLIEDWDVIQPTRLSLSWVWN